MSLTKTEIKKLKQELLETHRPLIFFDDDADGICAFALFYRFVKDGKGIIMKTYPKLDHRFVRKIDEYHPDKVFVLDTPEITPEFIRDAKSKIVWLDHHQPNKQPGTVYFNPMVHDTKDDRPTSYWAFKVVEQDMWLSMVGCVGDWHLPDFAPEFSKRYPDLLPPSIIRAEDALFETRIGFLSRIIGFIAKGPTREAMSCIKILTRVKNPYEILDQTTSQGKYIYKKYVKINNRYENLKKGLKVDDEKLLLFMYPSSMMSFTSDLSNELLHKYPDKFIIVGRKKSGEAKLSLRSKNEKVLQIVENALEGVDGYGGGHEYACGACIKSRDFNKFVENIKRQLE